ncbi:MAG: right-handed parallel beta-helix repeat-containing protein [Pseudomonadales bacterium]|nr:right-handed parallel beta-helix repeat-containing protein [Pseudomonadales bacterium]
MRLSMLLPGLLLVATACSRAPEPVSETPAAPEAPYEETLRLALETATPGTVIDIPSGVHRFSRGLVLNTSGVTLRGAGIDLTVLSFKEQVAGAEGLLVNAGDFIIEDLAIEDTVGDALKINGGRNVVIRRVRTEWTNGPDTGNGAYGIYPVQTENTLIEDSVAIGASDAGIYVGQSRNVVVRNNRAEYNVAGIEIENTVGADVYGNLATNNTGGVLVFNMPDLPVTGHTTRVYDNDVIGNNTTNFGAPGSAVASVPAGSGIVINSNDRVEIFGNRIGDNRTANILISSLFSAEYSQTGESAPDFDPYPEEIFIHGNTFTPGGSAPDRAALDTLRTAVFGADGRLPDILWDGVTNPAGDQERPALCIDNPGATFVNVDAANDYQAPSTDLTPHACRLEPLPAVTLVSAN